MFRLLVTTVLAVMLAASPLRAAERTIRLGQVGLSFYAVVGAVVEATLAGRGYVVEVVEGSHAEIFPKLGKGEVDLFAAAWLPTGHASLYRDVADTTFLVAPLYDGASFFWAVPSYVPQDAVVSIADLARPEVSARTKKRIVSLPEATGLTTGGRRAMELYGLSKAGFELVAAPPGEWMSAFQAAHDAGEWIVFPLWQPQWANRGFDLRRLDDPLAAYGPPDTAHLVGHVSLRERIDRQTLGVLTRIRISVADVTEMDRLVNVGRVTPRSAAAQWMSRNATLVASWSE